MIKVMFRHKRELGGGERIFCPSRMVRWFKFIGNHNLVVKL